MELLVAPVEHITFDIEVLFFYCKGSFHKLHWASFCLYVVPDGHHILTHFSWFSSGPVSIDINDLNIVSYHDLFHQVALSNHLTTRWPCPSNLGPSLCPSQGWTSLVLQSASFMWGYICNQYFETSYPPQGESQLPEGRILSLQACQRGQNYCLQGSSKYGY